MSEGDINSIKETLINSKTTPPQPKENFVDSRTDGERQRDNEIKSETTFTQPNQEDKEKCLLCFGSGCSACSKHLCQQRRKEKPEETYHDFNMRNGGCDCEEGKEKLSPSPHERFFYGESSNGSSVKEVMKALKERGKVDSSESRGDWRENFRNEFGSYECLYTPKKSKKGDWYLINDIEDFIQDLLTLAHTEGIEEGFKKSEAINKEMVSRVEISSEMLKKAKQEGIDEGKKLAIEVSEYCQHQRGCILDRFEAGRPTKDGYEQKFDGKWYQVRPKDETPKCDCGLSSLISSLQTKETKNNE